MLDKVLETSKFVVDNAKHVKINYDKANELIDELLKFDNVHYLTKVPYGVYDMSTRDIINFLLIYDSIDFSFWGNPKWTINVNGKTKRVGRNFGKTSDWKKAIVTIDTNPGQKTYLTEGGKVKKVSKKYKDSIEEFMGA